MEQFKKQKTVFERRFAEDRGEIFDILKTDIDNVEIERIESILSDKVDKLHKNVLEYRDFLQRTKTEEASQMIEGLNVDYEKIIWEITTFKDRLTSVKHSAAGMVLPLGAMTTRSVHSTSSKAKAAAAKARLHFAEVEAKLKKEKADFEERLAVESAAAEKRRQCFNIDLELVQERKHAAERQAEAEVLESQCDIESVREVKSDIMNPSNVTSQDNGLDQLTKFLLRKDLSMSRLSHFSDKPEHFQSWKNSFKSVCSEMGVSPAEELDLLIKWLGKESSKHAVSIRTAYPHDPKLGLNRLWERLEERYGSVEHIHKSVLKKLDNFQRISVKESEKLYELSDILSEVEALHSDPKYAMALSYFNTSVGVAPIVNKLPHFLQERWVTHASNYKDRHEQTFPPLSEFVTFVKKQARIRNDPSLVQVEQQCRSVPKSNVSSRKTGVVNINNSESEAVNDLRRREANPDTHCIIHRSNSHDLENCRTFKAKSYDDKRKFIKDQKLCFKCFQPDHMSKHCSKHVVCEICTKSHNTLLHANKETVTTHGGEGPRMANSTQPRCDVSSSCTEICGERNFSGKSCAKICLVRIRNPETNESIISYAIIDDQSNRTLAKPFVYNTLQLQASDVEYTINSCNGQRVTFGRVADCVIESLDGAQLFEARSVLECDDIPNTRHEIPTPEVAKHHPHLKDIKCHIPALNTTDISLLIGRDIIEVHRVLDQRFGPKGSPYAQKLPLGWVIVGEVCIGSHKENMVTVNKTYLLPNGRESIFQPCPNTKTVCECSYDPVFQRNKDDENISLSVEDRQFLSIMGDDVKKENGNWSAPLPFRENRPKLPNNYEYAMHRAKSFQSNLERNPKKQSQVFDFMGKLIDQGYAEVAPKLESNEERWYLPVFAVYHPHKPDQVRCVFDSSATYSDASLNKMLLQGPDLTNSLIGILFRFRRMPVAIVADIQQMFYSFHVHKEHRNFLRFLWHKNNDSKEQLIEYRMTVHVFGNSPSPSIATHCLQRSVENADRDVQEFVRTNFYVDDALTSVESTEKAVDLMKRTQNSLAGSNIVLHKVASNKQEVVMAFSPDQLAKELKDLNPKYDALPTQRSLGLLWDMNEDTFKFDIPLDDKPFTKRGILSTVNSIFDPIGFLAPVTIQGKLILRNLMKDGSCEWDEPMPPSKMSTWLTWKDSLAKLGEICIPRCYSNMLLSKASRVELFVFSDASELAIAAAVYLVAYSSDQTNTISFAFGKTKVAPISGHTMPRLELCAAVLAVQIATTVQDNLQVQIHDITYYTDSKIVLGYINNVSRRFTRYVSNRGEAIRKLSSPKQWKYVSTRSNPADIGTRGIKAEKLQESMWLTGPPKSVIARQTDPDTDMFPLVNPEDDNDVKKEVSVSHTDVTANLKRLGPERFTRFSSWKRLVSAIALLMCRANKGDNTLLDMRIEKQRSAEKLILCEVQRSSYSEEYKRLEEGKELSSNCSIAKLSPYLDHSGLIRVGGRLKNSPELSSAEKNPVILPGKQHIAVLLSRHYHEEVCHQGRHITEGAIRAAGFWIVAPNVLYRTSYTSVFSAEDTVDDPSNRRWLTCRVTE